MRLDAAAITDGASLSAAVCIVGAGPAGLALADALREGRHTVVVLEGGAVPAACDLAVQPLDVREPYVLSRARACGVGGTALLWNSWHDGVQSAKYVPLDDIDFEPRDWVPDSGWPFTREVLLPWYGRAYELCGIRGGVVDHSAAGNASDASALRAGTFRLGPSAQFRSVLPDRLDASATVQLVRGATATGFERDASGDVTAVHFATEQGARGVVRAGAVVLAAGGVENARILLEDRAASGRALAAHDWLGRGFMEHPIDRSLVVRSRRPLLGLDPHFRAPTDAGNGPVLGRLGLTAGFQREHRLPNLSIRFGDAEEPVVAPPASLRPAVHRIVPWPSARRAVGGALRRLLATREWVRGTSHRLVVDLEQYPQRDNRVVLSAARDRYGRATAELHYGWRAHEDAMRLRVRDAVVSELRRMGLGTVRVDVDRPVDPHAHHHAGTTRMHHDAAKGVVDADLRVHGEANLYVVGSSVFPTAGVANPTLTIVALCARLARHLSDTLRP